MRSLHPGWWQLLLVLILLPHRGVERVGGNPSSPGGTSRCPFLPLRGMVLQPWTPVWEPWSSGNSEVSHVPLETQTIAVVPLLKGSITRGQDPGQGVPRQGLPRHGLPRSHRKREKGQASTAGFGP